MTTDELRGELERALERPVARLERRPFEYSTSFVLEALDVWLGGPEPERLLFKDVSPGAMCESARGVKPAFVYDPLREIEAYRSILEPHALGTARCYGAVVDEERGRFWLFLERVAGRELYQLGELALWEEAARWLASLHVRCRDARTPHLLRYDADLYRLWLQRAREFTGSPALERLAAGYGRVVERLISVPAGFVHGEFYASNVLVQENGARVRVCPVDWEMAAVGPILLDLAALTAGDWDDDERARVDAAYLAALPDGLRRTLDEVGFAEALDCCRLHLAIQWLGWARDWSPPPEHATDWLAEALRTGERLGL